MLTRYHAASAQDTTYADERYAFPSQEAALADVASRCASFRAAHPRGLVVVGAYAIGKERVALAASAALRQCGIYCDPSRARTYACFQWDALQALLAPDAASTPLHVVPMAWLNNAKLGAYLARHPRHDALLALRPTGWAHNAAAPGAGGRPSRATSSAGNGDGRVQITGVPYSEHSSAAELQGFLQALRPRRVVPTVGVGAPAKREAMMRLIDAWMAS